ncbi:hypothetical protein ACIQU5_00610 [Streptomyces sp. NPDC090306]|uniref:hypothetical protein n=1 Tax=Streptomyces sp. NPDC090306 TaxID=3365961 RepID=UPI00381982BA
MHRHLLALVTVCALALPWGAGPASASGAGAREYCRITASSASVRAEPRRHARVLGTAYRGDTCVSRGWAEGDGVWVKITVRRTGVKGYVHSSLVAWGKESLTATG